MIRPVAIIYLIWSFLLIGTGIYIIKRMSNTSDPASISSKMDKLKKVMNEDPSVP